MEGRVALILSLEFHLNVFAKMEEAVEEFLFQSLQIRFIYTTNASLTFTDAY